MLIWIWNDMGQGEISLAVTMPTSTSNLSHLHSNPALHRLVCSAIWTTSDLSLQIQRQSFRRSFAQTQWLNGIHNLFEITDRLDWIISIYNTVFWNQRNKPLLFAFIHISVSSHSHCTPLSTSALWFEKYDYQHVGQGCSQPLIHHKEKILKSSRAW